MSLRKRLGSGNCPARLSDECARLWLILMATVKDKPTGVIRIQRGVQALNARGILMTCSAGNDALDTDTNPHPPSTLTSPNIIAVAATQSVLPSPC